VKNEFVDVLSCIKALSCEEVKNVRRQKRRQCLGQAIVGILVALIAGGTAPWWWGKVTGNSQPTPTTPTSSSPTAPSVAPIESQLTPTTPTSSSPTAPSVAPIEDNEQRTQVETVIETSWLTDLVAFEKLDKEKLRASYTGEALKSQGEVVDAVRSKNSFAVYIYDNSSKTEFEDYQEIEKSKRVKIRVSRKILRVEYWYISPKVCGGYQPGFTKIRNVYLEKTSAGWLISSFKNVNDPVAIIDGCSFN
jgi:cytoskeletal protein RodZ